MLMNAWHRVIHVQALKNVTTHQEAIYANAVLVTILSTITVKNVRQVPTEQVV
uniref:Uncharacterized protein n=1 Tax=Arion vulgaris TaxID=1028688 RepID=A0A0B7BMX9_9EUPU